MTILGIAIDPTNIEGSIVTGVDTLIEAQIAKSLPSTSKLKTLNALIEASSNTARELLDVYVMAKAIAAFGNVLTAAAAKWPVIATEIAAIRAKIPGL